MSEDSADEIKPSVTLSYVRAALEARVRADPSFREHLLANPAAVFAELTGFELPDGFQLVLVDDRVYLQLPDECFKVSKWAVGLVEAPAWRMIISNGSTP